jgi:hypothetical protein
MDDRSHTVAEFLTALQRGMERLEDVWSHYAKLGARPHKPYLTLSGHPYSVHAGGEARQFDGAVAMGLLVTTADDRVLELGVDLLWRDDGWTLLTEAWEEDVKDQRLRRALPQRHAGTLRAALEHLADALADLERFDDLVVPPKPAGSR